MVVASVFPYFIQLKHGDVPFGTLSIIPRSTNALNRFWCRAHIQVHLHTRRNECTTMHKLQVNYNIYTTNDITTTIKNIAEVSLNKWL